jgi:hypothetical protein
MDENNDEMSGISRRSAIKRIGVGAAVVWSAPAIVSVSRAYGQAGSPGALGCPECDVNDLCSGQGFCSEDEITCPCSPQLDGETCFCWQGPHDSCANFIRCDPETQTGCPGDETCVPTCCFVFDGQGVCVNPCGGAPHPTPAGGAAAVGGPRTDGK